MASATLPSPTQGSLYPEGYGLPFLRFKPMPKFSDKDFEVEEDARTLQRSAEIVGDKKRHKRAKAKMAQMKKDLDKAITIHDRF